MLNKIWFWLLLVGILYGLGKGTVRTIWPDLLPASQVIVESEPLQDNASASNSSTEAGAAEPLVQASKNLNNAAFDAATSSVEICIGLIGAMALWLGLLKVAQDAGLVDAIARGLSPLMRWLFPGVPDGHPAQGAILMNMSANMLGLDNAATPMGLKAMRELQSLNPTDDTATNDMAMFMAINTSSVTLIPFTIIAYRVSKHSENATKPLFGMIVATSISTIAAIIAVRWLSRWRAFAMPAVAQSVSKSNTSE